MSTYRIGTVTVSNGSTSVTGSGTSWVAAQIRAGDFLFVNGLFGEIASVQSNTALTLVRGWPGSSGSGQQYSIAMIDDGQRSIASLNQVLQALGQGTLTSLAALSAGANQMPFFTGAGVMALTGLTSQARSVLASALLSVSGNNLVTAANARVTGEAVTQSASDSTVGRLLKTGDAGILGAPLIAPPDLGLTDNSLARGAWYVSEPATLGLPATLSNARAYVLHHRRTGNGEIQVAMVETTTAEADRTLWTRRRTGAGWGIWKRVYDWGNILGTVSQSAGAPTGAIIERGNNANGEFVRFADGTQLCTWLFNFPDIPITTAAGTIFNTATELQWTLPASFLTTTNAVCVASVRSGASIWSRGRITGNGTAQVRLFSPTSLTSSLFVEMLAIGRWF